MSGQFFKIVHGSIQDCLEMTRQIREFADDKYNKTDYNDRLANKEHLILIARTNEKKCGFKIGYKQETDGSFYSWMGGVLPEFRRQGIAKALSDQQEAWAKEHKYTAITFKTRNYLKPMLIFALKNGFNIVEVIAKETISNHRIILRKELGKSE